MAVSLPFCLCFFDGVVMYKRFLFVLLLVLGSVPAGASQYSIIHEGRGLSLHKEMYVMPATWSNKYSGEETEMVFQISAKQQVLDTSFYFAYTQKSYWQAFNEDESSPFRETNYNPEVFYRFVPGLLGGNVFLNSLGADIGFEHESNGRSLPDSRSWNRLYFTPFYANGNQLVWLKLWYRIPEGKKDFPEDTTGDDNPDITDFLGYAELHYQHQFFNDQLIHLMARGNMNEGKGAVSLTYSIPTFSGNTFVMIRGFSGYGESLIDYNHSVSRIGIGLMFSR